MSAVLIASITRLCGLDHGDDPAAIADWTANKSPAGISTMMADPRAGFFVAETGDGTVAAVGCVVDGNEIGLNYVHPDHRFRGVSRALLATMETAMRAAGSTEARVKITRTAHRFYLANGWQDAGDPYTGRFILAWPMLKRL